ncbi:MAG TPA: hypothetical protein VFF52_27675 [Isosphaeraceae bacterium]|nr:hypothetical protein [Isosphaeraceae bacterium]
MLLESAWIFAAFSSVQVFSLWIVGMGVAVVTLVSLAGIIVPAWANVHKIRLETSLKKQMIERGMPAEQILQVLNGRRQDPSGLVDYPCASEVVVESEGEWNPSLILKRDGERYLIHYVGTDMSDNEWVTSDRVRFPAGTNDACGSPWDWLSAAGTLDASRWCAQKSKPAPVDVEL